MAIVDLIVVALIALVAFLVYQRRTTGAATDDQPRADPEMRLLRDEVLELRARVQVLERVITDNHGSVDLLQEIDRLRDR